MNRIIVILALVIGGCTGAWLGWKHVRKTIYDEGYSSALASVAMAAEEDRRRAQTNINSIEKNAIEAAKKAADQQIASKVERAIADVRKSNPSCSLSIPGGVLDALRNKAKP